MLIERNKRLVKDFAVYGFGILGNRLFVFLLYPVLSFFLEKQELGYYDLSLETVLFLLPVITLQMRESTFRLLIDTNDESYKRHILTTTFVIEGVMLLIVTAIAPILSIFFTIRHFFLIVLSIYAYSLYELYLQAIRAIYSSKCYVLASLITSFTTVVLTFLLFFVFNRGIEALFIGTIVARITAILVIELPRRKIIGSLSLHYFKKKYAKEILHYSIPLMWAAISYAFITFSGKFFVAYFLGSENNGILAIAQKYMSILLLIGVPFHLAWQETSVKYYQEKDRERYFSDVFNKYAVALCVLSLIFSFGLRFFKSFLMGAEYYPSINLIYVYCISATFFCLAQFFEVIFQCTKQTSKILFSFASCAIISLPLTIFLTKYYGLMGTVIALIIAYLYLFLYRFFQTKKTLPVRLNKSFYLAMFLLAFGGIIFYYTTSS